MFQTVENTRGDLKIPDIRFILSMKNFSDRLIFYQKMMTSFEQITIRGKKHCNLSSTSIKYEEIPPNWDVEYDGPLDPLEYVPLISDFGSMVDIDKHCKTRNKKFMDPKEFRKNYVDTETEQKKVEVYSMALIILRMEIMVMTMNLKIIGNRELPTDQDYMQEMSQIYGSFAMETIAYANNPFSKNPVWQVFQAFMDFQTEWKMKGKEETYSYHYLSDDVEMFIRGLKVMNKYLIMKTAKNNDFKKESIVTDINKHFDTFQYILQLMLRENITEREQKYRRTTAGEVKTMFKSLVEPVQQIESTIELRRSLLLI